MELKATINRCACTPEITLPQKSLEKFRRRFKNQFTTDKNRAKIDSIATTDEKGATFFVSFWDWALNDFFIFFAEFCAEEKISFQDPRIS